MKRLMGYLLLFLLLMLPACCAQAEELTVVEASDLHYLSPALAENRALLMQFVERADGKLTHYTPEITKAFVDEMLTLMPDALVLSGDLTLDGDRDSHQELIALLQPLREAGIAVLAIPGNHDCAGIAHRFTMHGTQPLLAVREEEFTQLYADLGWNQARARDTVSFSYVYELRPDLWFLMVDANANKSMNILRDETLAWVEEQLIAAQAAGARVISVTHENLLGHFSLFNAGFQISNADQLLALYARYGVKLNLSGHMHLQHIVTEQGVTDIATSALPVCPNQYGILKIDATGIRYDTRELDVASWARTQGLEDENLLNFAAYSRTFFDNTTRVRRSEMLAKLQIPDEEKERMLTYSLDLNHAVFAGLGTQSMDHTPLALWQKYQPEASFTNYILSLQNVAGTDMRHWAGEW